MAALLLALSLVAAVAGPAVAGGDRDADGMPDSWEEAHGLDPDDPSDATEDPDGDDLVNRDEYLHAGDPHAPDTDGDGLKDGPEVTRWHTRVDVPNRIVGRVGVVRRCPTRDKECALEFLFAVRVVLRDSEGELFDRTRTFSNGRFAFEDVPPGRYEVAARAVAGIGAPGPVELEVEEGQAGPARVRVRMRNVNGSGVVGQATQGPMCPAQREGDECVAALADAPIRVKDLYGEVVAEAVTGPAGFYAFELEPGYYRLVAKRVNDEGLPDPPRRRFFEVAASDRGPRVLNSSYDSGIR